MMGDTISRGAPWQGSDRAAVSKGGDRASLVPAGGDDIATVQAFVVHDWCGPGVRVMRCPFCHGSHRHGRGADTVLSHCGDGIYRVDTSGIKARPTQPATLPYVQNGY